MVYQMWLKILLFMIFFNANIAEKQFHIYGPGLNAKFNMPVRYFFIKDINFNRNSSNISKEFFKISFFDANSKNNLKIRYEILDRHDGVFILRFRLYSSYKDLYINIKDIYGNDLDKSPYLLKGNLIQDHCECVETDVDEWYKTMECNQTYNQIDRDIKKFKNTKIDMSELHDIIVNKYNQRYSQSLCNYVIKDNKIYRKCYGQYVDFNMFSDSILLSLVRKVKLPDVDFFMNLGDWPLNEKSQNKLLPIVSWCGSDDANDMILPTYDITESTLEMMGRQSLDIMTIFHNSLPKWELKLNKSFWRGRDSRKERLRLVDFSKKYPDLIDASLTHMFFFREPENLEKYGQLAQRTPFFDFFKYKYQLNIDGTVAAYRYPYLLSGNSLVFKQESKFYEHFYQDLKPFEHFVPIKRDLSDLKYMLEWAISNDQKAQEIVKNAQNFSKEYLMPNHIFCYHVKFFMAYSKLLKSRVEIRNGMEKVNQPIATNCNCNRLNENLKIEL